MREVPCKQCPVYAACRARYMQKPKFFIGEKFGSSIFDLAHDEDCEILIGYLTESDQDDVNRARALYNMDPYQ